MLWVEDKFEERKEIREIFWEILNTFVLLRIHFHEHFTSNNTDALGEVYAHFCLHFCHCLSV